MHFRNVFSISATLAVGVAVGCSGQPAAEQEAAAQTTESAISHAANTSAPEMVTGAVVETMNSGGYTYVKVDTGADEVWAATSEFEVEPGDRVTFPLETPMQDFHSNTLERDFPVIYFASFIVPEGEAPAVQEQGAPQLPPGHPSIDAFAVNNEPVASGEIARPAGSMAIADVWKDRVDLAGSTVTLTGKVVKYNPGILGRNWFHIQDGSGEFGDGTNDITVTTNSNLAVGDVVTVTGTVAVDKDFGAGYTYTVMIEDADVARQ